MPWADKLAQDVWYVDHRSFPLDVRILLRTLWVMVTRQQGCGGSAPGASTVIGSCARASRRSVVTSDT
jgi:hypothetical protein